MNTLPSEIATKMLLSWLSKVAQVIIRPSAARARSAILEYFEAIAGELASTEVDGSKLTSIYIHIYCVYFLSSQMIPIWWRYFDSLTALLQILWYIGSYKVSDLAEQFKIRGHRSIEAASVAGQQPVFLSAEAGFQLFPFVARMMSNGTCTWNKRLQVRSFQILLLYR